MQKYYWKETLHFFGAWTVATLSTIVIAVFLGPPTILAIAMERIWRRRQIIAYTMTSFFVIFLLFCPTIVPAQTVAAGKFIIISKLEKPLLKHLNYWMIREVPSRKTKPVLV